MYSKSEMEKKIIEILKHLGEPYESYIYDSDRDGDYVSDVFVGLKYHFDKLVIWASRNVNDHARKQSQSFSSFNVSYDSETIYCGGCGPKYQITNNQKLLTFFEDLYNSLDELVKNKEEEKTFFKNYGGLIPWKKFSNYNSNEQTKNYISELNITLLAKQRVTYGGNDSTERYQSYKIYNGTDCVYDSEANIFIDGKWKDKLIEYMLNKKEEEEKAKLLKKEKEFSDNFSNSLQLLRKLKNN